MDVLNKIKRNQMGFTLVEAVVAIAIIGVIGVIMSDILTRAFDNTQKTNLISNVQQNGQSALSAFEDTIRYSEFVCLGGIDSQGLTEPNRMVSYTQPVLVVFREGRYIRLRIIPQSGNTNGFISEDYPAEPAIDKTATDLCRSPFTSINSRKVTNDTMLSVKSGSIMLLSNPVNTTQTIGTKDVSVNINFAIGSFAGSASTAESQIGQNNEVVFQSTAQFR